MNLDSGQGRTAQIARQTRSHEFVAVLEALLPRALEYIEQCGLVMLLAAFWGLVLFLAISVALA